MFGFLNAIKNIALIILPQLITAAVDYAKHVYSEKIKHKNKEEINKKDLENEQKAKTPEEQENAFKDTIDHANGD